MYKIYLGKKIILKIKLICTRIPYHSNIVKRNPNTKLSHFNPPLLPMSTV